MLNAILNELNVAVFIIDDGSTERRFNPEFAVLWIYRRIPPRHSSCAAMRHAPCACNSSCDVADVGRHLGGDDASQGSF